MSERAFLHYLDVLTARLVSARIIAKAINDMKGSAVRAVFEAAGEGKLELLQWRRRALSAHPLLEEVRLEGRVRATGRRFAMVSPPFGNGLIEEAAALAARMALAQADERERGMPVLADLKIKGLTDAVRAAREGISSARSAVASVQESTMAFVSAAGEIKKQIDAATDDLVFEATSLGNAGPPSAENSSAPAAGGDDEAGQ